MSDVSRRASGLPARSMAGEPAAAVLLGVDDTPSAGIHGSPQPLGHTWDDPSQHRTHELAGLPSSLDGWNSRASDRQSGTSGPPTVGPTLRL